jgi:hypothetical protein
LIAWSASWIGSFDDLVKCSLDKPVAIVPGGSTSAAMVGKYLLREKICIGCGVRLDFWGNRPHEDLCAPLNDHRHGCPYDGESAA